MRASAVNTLDTVNKRKDRDKDDKYDHCDEIEING